ncbi:transposase [Amazonocrinis nigriterrae]|nr:transposase [Amazonocrinis nigriterrae]
MGTTSVMLSTWNGIPIAYDLVPANTDERIAANGVLSTVRHSDIYADKGFISADWQAASERCLATSRYSSPSETLTRTRRLRQRVYAHRTGNRIWTNKRDNQHLQHSDALKRFESRVRQPIEGVFHEIHPYWA